MYPIRLSLFRMRRPSLVVYGAALRSIGTVGGAHGGVGELLPWSYLYDCLHFVVRRWLARRYRGGVGGAVQWLLELSLVGRVSI